jgi:myo-inositol-1-phosphate synthase
MPSAETKPILLMIAGAKGAVGSTIAAAITAMKENPQVVLSCLTTSDHLPWLGDLQPVEFTGWDISPRTLSDSIRYHRVLPDEKWKLYEDDLKEIKIFDVPSEKLNLPSRIEKITRDIREIKAIYPNARGVLINLLPACVQVDLSSCESFSNLYANPDAVRFPDLAYIISAILCGCPVVNFTSNTVELPFLVEEAAKLGVPLSGRDGKTGQTYLKVVLASALKARNLLVDGWFSLNILGNEDGRNLVQPERAAGKLGNKTEVLDQVLGYRVGERHGESAHKVIIDYYPPRGDAKEAWDVIDFIGLFGLPMSLRLNLLARDSILAAPLVLDLARWMVALQNSGRSGLIPELAFFFKKPLGDDPPLTFQEQMNSLEKLAEYCRAKIAGKEDHVLRL